MKLLMVCLGMTILLLSGCGTMTVNMDYGNVTATSSLNESGDGELGWIELTGMVRDSNGTPLVGESVFCQQVSNYSLGLGHCSGTRYTDADGRFSFGPVFLHTTDTIILWAIPSSYELLEMKRLGLDVWKQPDFEFIYSVQPTPPSVQLSAGDLGWITIAGTLRDADGIPLAGETVTCTYVSEYPEVYSNRVTNIRGRFSCDTIFLRDTDKISVQVVAHNYAIQEITRSGLEIRQNPIFDFVFSQRVTPTPYLSPAPIPPTPVLATDTVRPTYTATTTSESALLPDLIIEYLYLEMEGRHGGCITAYTPYGIRVEIKNVGEVEAGAFAVDLNGSRQRVESGLAPGQRIELHFADTVESGQYQAYVDAANEVTESNEEDNTLSFQAPTPTPPPLCTPTLTPVPGN